MFPPSVYVRQVQKCLVSKKPRRLTLRRRQEYCIVKLERELASLQRYIESVVPSLRVD